MVNVLQPGAEDTVSHPVLTKMVFFDLPKLTSICCGKLLNCPNLSSIDVWRCQNLKLPLIESKTSKPHLKIRIIGEKSWIKKLKSDNPGSNTNFKLDDAPVPVFLLADTTGARAKREEGGNNDTINTYICSWITYQLQEQLLRQMKHVLLCIQPWSSYAFTLIADQTPIKLRLQFGKGISSRKKFDFKAGRRAC